MFFDLSTLPFAPFSQFANGDLQGWTEVNDAGGDPYLNYCPHCGWAGAVALWRDTPPGGLMGPDCPRCKGGNVGRLVPE